MHDVTDCRRRYVLQVTGGQHVDPEGWHVHVWVHPVRFQHIIAIRTFRCKLAHRVDTGRPG